MADTGSMNGIARAGSDGARTLKDEFRHASDAKLLKVTRMIDLLPERGQADALLDPVRDRLAMLRPARLMNRSRLLFTPFDRVLVPASIWRSGSLTLPRSLLTPILALLDETSISALPTPSPFDEGDPTELNRTGRCLWETAADCLAAARIPDAWTLPAWQMQSGVSVAMLETALPVVELVLRNAYVIRTLPARHHPTFEPTVNCLLIDAARTAPLGWGIMLALLFDAAPPDVIVRLALAVARGDRRMTILQSGLDLAITDMLARLEDMPILAGPTDQNHDGQVLKYLLARLEPMNQLDSLRRIDNRPADEQRRVGRLRQTMAAVNRALFERILSSRVQNFERVTVEDQASDEGIATIMAVESDARRMRTFVLAASRIEDGADYERLLEQASLRLAHGSHHSASTLVSRMRLIELLSGSERALQLLTANQTAGAR